MSSRSRAAAAMFVSAVEDHLAAVETSTGEADTGVRAAFLRLQVACLAYEDALYDEHDEVLPFEVVEDEDDDEDDEDEDDEDDEDDVEDLDDGDDILDDDELDDHDGGVPHRA
jgi:hypothetical protein